MVKIHFRETNTLWEGALEAPALTYRVTDGVTASIGEPFQWADGELLGEKWKPPVGGNRFYLVQLAFTLRPQGRTVVTSADFCLSLGGQADQRAIVFDAFPRGQTVAQNDSVTIGIGPDFKIGTGEVSLAKAEATFDLGAVIPVVSVDGLHEPRLCWHYRAHDKFPLSGSFRLAAIVSLPAGMKTARMTLELTANAESRFGPIRLSTPETAQARLRWVVGEK
jgi:hypothetical protein